MFGDNASWRKKKASVKDTLMTSDRLSTVEIVGDGQEFLAGEYLISVRDFAFRKGITIETLLADSRIPVETLLNPEQKIGEISMHQVGINLINALENPLGEAIEYGRSMNIGTHGALGIAIQGAKNLLEASALFTQFISIRASVREAETIVDGKTFRLRMVNKAGADPLREEFANETVRHFFELATFVNLENLGRQFLSHADLEGCSIINLTIEEPPNFPHQILEDTLKVQFNQPHIELCIPIEWTEIPFPSGNSALAQAATDRCESQLEELTPKDLILEIKERIRSAQAPKPKLEEMAAQLFMSTSTLQRRLKEQSTTYQKIKAEVRLDEAKTLLTNPNIKLEEISDRVGFSDASNFTKSFKSWTGLTPKEFRETHLES